MCRCEHRFNGGYQLDSEVQIFCCYFSVRDRHRGPLESVRWYSGRDNSFNRSLRFYLSRMPGFLDRLRYRAREADAAAAFSLLNVNLQILDLHYADNFFR